LHFGTRSTIDEDDAGDESLHGVQEASEDTSSVQHEARKYDVADIRIIRHLS